MGERSQLMQQAHLTTILLAWLELSNESYDVQFLADAVYSASFAQMSRMDGRPPILTAATALIVSVEAARRHGMSPCRVVVGANQHAHGLTGWLEDRGDNFTVEVARTAADPRLQLAVSAGSRAMEDVSDLAAMLIELGQLADGN